MNLRRTLVAVVVGGLAAGVAAGTANAAGATHLPTREDAIAAAINVECLLNGQGSGLQSILVHGCLETRIHGTVSDHELVHVDIGPDGAPLGVRVTQRLHIAGLGDFSFKVPGPATDVRALPGSDEQPGLRKGAVLWQGFSPGERTLAAVLDLHPDLEARRLPLRFTVHATIGGKPVDADHPASGPFVMRVRVDNISAVPVTISEAPADPTQVATALDAVHAALAGGRRPVPGEGGVPTELAATGPTSNRALQAEAPFRVAGVLRFPGGTITGVTAHGAEVSSGSSGTAVRFAEELGGGAPTSFSLQVAGTAHRLGLPDLQVQADPAPPLASSVEPAGGGSWTRFAATHPDASSRMVALLLDTLWRTARLSQYDSYLGNPQPAGPARSRYDFRLVPPIEQDTGPAPVVPGGVQPLGVLGFSLAGIAMLFGLAVAWSRA